jgi:uncharacterized membrane protein YbhN (UPF0104 family)
VPRRPLHFAWLKLVTSLALLAVLLWVLDRHALSVSLGRLRLEFLALAVVVTTLQFFVLSARWAVFANQLGVRLGYRRAIGEYYLSSLLNQVLPFGVLGDALRVLRHTERVHAGSFSPLSTPRVLLAAALDRISGQAIIVGAALASAPEIARGASRLAGASEHATAFGIAVLLVTAAVLAFSFRRRLSPARELARDGLRALFSIRSLARHVPLSCAMLGLSGVQFWASARALGFELSLEAAALIVPPVLLAAALPAFFSGWGVREAAAAALYHLAGLRAGEGVAVSVVFGLVSLVSSLPGLPVLWAARWSLDLEKSNQSEDL